jgi:protein SCO1/2
MARFFRPIRAPHMFNRTTLLILIVAVATAAGLVAAEFVFRPKAPAGPPLQTVRLLGTPRELPAFTLQQSDRTQLQPGELRGHWTLVFIGFTFCPDVCPTTLGELAQAQKQWETLPDITRPRVLFVSVDPERDSVDRLGEYAHGFHKDTLAATADIPTLENFARSLSLVFAKVPLGKDAPPDQYTIDHSATLVVLDPQGRMAGVIQPPLKPKAIAEDLIALTRSTQKAGG